MPTTRRLDAKTITPDAPRTIAMTASIGASPMRDAPPRATQAMSPAPAATASDASASGQNPSAPARCNGQPTPPKAFPTLNVATARDGGTNRRLLRPSSQTAVAADDVMAE